MKEPLTPNEKTIEIWSRARTGTDNETEVRGRLWGREKDDYLNFPSPPLDVGVDH